MKRPRNSPKKPPQQQPRKPPIMPPSQPSTPSDPTAKLIVIEGGDGAGKQTQSQALVARLQAKGYRAERIAFPCYETNIAGGLIKRLLHGEFGSVSALAPELRMLMFAADRFETLPRIQQAQAQNDVVVIDRYVGSNAVYQGALLPEDEFEPFARMVFDFELKILPRPDLTVFLNAAPEASRSMAEARAELDAYEANRDLQAAVAGRYARLAAWQLGGPWAQVDVMAAADGYRAIDVIADDVWQAVQSACNLS